MDCLFCRIINESIGCYKIYEDDIVLAFLDIRPDTNGHTLLIPKKHFNDLNDIDLETIKYMFRIVKKIKAILEEKLNCDGITIVQNNGDVQEIKHFHIHIKPYYNSKQKIRDLNEIKELLKS